MRRNIEVGYKIKEGKFEYEIVKIDFDSQLIHVKNHTTGVELTKTPNQLYDTFGDRLGDTSITVRLEVENINGELSSVEFKAATEKEMSILQSTVSNIIAQAKKPLDLTVVDPEMVAKWTKLLNANLGFRGEIGEWIKENDASYKEALRLTEGN